MGLITRVKNFYDLPSHNTSVTGDDGRTDDNRTTNSTCRLKRQTSVFSSLTWESRPRPPIRRLYSEYERLPGAANSSSSDLQVTRHFLL